MKKLSEVTKITGLSRRQLQEYDRLGLLSPSSKTESGYWLYDEEAIYTLYFIQIFTEAGYKRKEIKELLNKEELELSNLLEEVIERLNEQKSHIDGMINFLNTAKLSLKNGAFLQLINNITYVETNNYKARLNSYFDEFSKIEKDEYEKFMSFNNCFYEILAQIGKEFYDDEVQKSVYKLYQNVKSWFTDDGNSGNWINKEEFGAIMTELFDNNKSIKETFGGDSYAFLKAAIKYFVENK